MVDVRDFSKQVGQHFGNYRLLQPLSFRKDAVLYLAEHLYLGTQARLKLYVSRLFQNDQQSFLTEAETLAHLVHPHIVRILEGGITHDIPFLVMAPTMGMTLRQQYPVGTRLPLPTIISFVKQIALALDYAHEQQVLHLDVRPDNVWIGHNNNVLLSDFRMTLLSHNSRSESIEDVVATVAYMAPEQMQGHAVPESDQYMLGIAVYEWLCGSLPFLSQDYIKVARQHLYDSPPSLRERIPGLPASVEQVVTKALAKESTQRFPSVQVFADMLEQSYLAPWNVANPPAVFTARSPEQITPSPATKNSTSRRHVMLGLAGLAGTAALATAGSVVWFSRQKPPSKPAKVKIVPTPTSTPIPTPIPPPMGTTLYTYQGHNDVVYGVDWSRDGKAIASWSRDDTMKVWNATTFELISTNPMALVMAWSPDWQLTASGDVGVLEVWERSTGHTRFEYSMPVLGITGPRELPVKKFVQWSSDGKYLANAISSSSMQVWDVSTGKPLFSEPWSAVAWSSDSKRLALLLLTGTNAPVKVQVLDVTTQNLITSYMVPGHNSFSLWWSPDGKYMVSGDGNVWNATTGEHITTYQFSPSWSMAWSPNSQYFATFDNSQGLPKALNQQFNPTSADPTVHIWNALTGEEVFVYRGHTAGVNDVAWSPDGTKIASASADMTVKVWQAVAM